MKLSDKTFIHEVVELLGAQKKPIENIINTLINDDNYVAYFDETVAATESTGYEMQLINQDGDELPYVNGAPPTLISGSGKKIIEAEVVIDGGIFISVFRFEHDGKKYCGADNEGTNLQPISLDSDSIYFNRSDFDSDVAKPPYLDDRSEYYAPELDLAIQLHQAIYIEKYGNQGQSREDRIISWLAKNYSGKKLSDAAFKRLSAVIAVDNQKKK